MQVEKYTPRRVNKDISPSAIEPGNGDRKLLPGDLIDAENCRYFTNDGGHQFVVESVRGNVQKAFTLPVGTNQCIGSFRYNKENSIVYFIWNSNQDHRVIQFNFDTNDFTVLLSGSSLNFDKDYKINQGGVVADFMMWNDRKNPVRKINLARAKQGVYTAPYGLGQISLIAKPPLDPPTFVYATEPSSLVNYISKTIYQFAHQIIYLDGEESVFSPPSALAYYGEVFTPTIIVDNVLEVTVIVPANLIGLIRTINVAYREGNDGNYFIFKQIRFPTSAVNVARFTGNDVSIAVPLTKQVQLYDRMPPVVDSFGLIDNRAFISLNNMGFDITTEFSLTVSTSTETADNRRRYAKFGGSYNVGVFYKDDFGQITFVKARQSLSIAFPAISSSGMANAPRTVINWVLAGEPPPRATKYQLAISKNQNQTIYGQCMVICFLYQSQMPPNTEEGNVYDKYYIWRGRKWAKPERVLDGSDHGSFTPDYKYVYLQYPLNFAFVPDQTYYVRILTPGFPEVVVPIIGIEEDFIIIDLKYTGTLPSDPRTPFAGWINWDSYPILFVEIFLPTQGPDDRFYETGPVYDVAVSGGGVRTFSVTSGKIYADTYFVKSVKGKYPFQFTPMVLNTTVYVPKQQNYTVFGANPTAVESPSGVFSSALVSIATATKTITRVVRGGDNSTSIAGGAAVTAVFSIDYNRIASDLGRALIMDETERILDQRTSVGFSDPFVLNTLIFGMNTFMPENKEDLARQRTAIRGLQASGQVLLAIHERKTTSLYIGQGFIQQGKDMILTKTDAVIGDDRLLDGDFGTINPESIIEINGQVYWWDAFQGAVVENSQGGNFPVSSHGMERYFYSKAIAMAPYRATNKVYTGYDGFNNELLITFPAIPAIGMLAETWAFSLQGRFWTTRYSFIPEWYAALNKKVFSFLGGQMWVHEESELFNNFYGVQFQRHWTFACNPHLGKNKRYLNIHIREQQAAVPDSEFAVVEIVTEAGQSSYIPAYEFELDEGKYVAPVLKDVNTPAVGTGRLALRSGDDMVSNYALITIKTDRTDKAPCSQVNVIFKTEEYSI